MTNNADHPRPWLKSYDAEVKLHLDYPRKPLPAFLEESAQKYPTRTCTIFEGRKLTYDQVWRYARGFAAALVELGVRKGDRVGLALSNSPSFVIAFYGILLAGGAVVAINPLYKAGEFAFMVENAGVEVIVGQAENLDVIRSLASATKLRIAIISDIHLDAKRLVEDRSGGRSSFEIDHADGVTIVPFLQCARAKAGTAELPAIDPDADAAVFQYSGGTTGTPKAAIGLHRNLAANTLQFRSWLWSLREGRETALNAIPLYHVYGMVIGLSVGIHLGASLLLEADPRDLDRLLADVETHRPGLFPCVPSLYSAILSKTRASEKPYDLTSLRVCISGSAPLLPAVKEAFEALTGGKVLEGFGLSEAPTATHCNPLGGTNKAGSIGLPLPDVDCRLVPFSDKDYPHETAGGELLIRGPQIMAGYFNAPDADRDILADGWLHTGDVAAMDEQGYFFILGRKKDLIKVGGLQVWPAEVESILSAHPAVKEACVAGIPGPEKSELVKAWVVLKDGQGASADGLRGWVRERLAHYKVPALVEFLDALPRSPVGKVLRRELVREHVEREDGNRNLDP